MTSLLTCRLVSRLSSRLSPVVQTVIEPQDPLVVQMRERSPPDLPAENYYGRLPDAGYLGQRAAGSLDTRAALVIRFGMR
jgi:hypothetical protein